MSLKLLTFKFIYFWGGGGQVDIICSPNCITVVHLIFVGINFCGFSENNSSKDM